MWQEQREELLGVAQKMFAEGLVGGLSGNASLRLKVADGGSLVLITPSRRHYEELFSEDMVVLDLEGEPVEGELMPSSESHLHLAIHKARQDVGGIVHTHSPYASVAAVAGLAIPPIVDEMVIALGGEVRVAEYGFPGTEELSDRALAALEDRNAVLLKNHGMVGVGPTLGEALEVCRLVERVAQIYVHASMLGRATPLPPEMVEIERSLFLMQREARSASGGADGHGP